MSRMITLTTDCSPALLETSLVEFFRSMIAIHKIRMQQYMAEPCLHYSSQMSCIYSHPHQMHESMFLGLFVCFQARTPSGIKGLFHKQPKQSSLDGHAAASAQHSPKHPFGAHLLRRTASAPTKGQPKIKKGFPEMTKDNSSEGGGKEREPENKASAAASHQPTMLHQGGSLPQEKGQRDHPDTNGTFHPEEAKGKSSPSTQSRPMSEPLKRVNRLCFYEPLDMKAGVFTRVAVNSSGRVGLSSNCITCVMGSKDSPETERKCLVKEEQDRRNQTKSRFNAQAVGEQKAHAGHTTFQDPLPFPRQCVEGQAQLRPVSFSRSKARQTLADWRVGPQAEPSQRNVQSCIIPRKRSHNAVRPALTADCRADVHPHKSAPTHGPVCVNFINRPNINGCLLLSSSSCDSFSSLSSLDSPPTLPPCSVFNSRKRAVGTLQRELNALFTQKMEELHLKSPMFFAGKISVRRRNPVEAFGVIGRTFHLLNDPDPLSSSHLCYQLDLDVRCCNCQMTPK